MATGGSAWSHLTFTGWGWNTYDEWWRLRWRSEELNDDSQGSTLYVLCHWKTLRCILNRKVHVNSRFGLIKGPTTIAASVLSSYRCITKAHVYVLTVVSRPVALLVLLPLAAYPWIHREPPSGCFLTTPCCLAHVHKIKGRTFVYISLTFCFYW